MSNLDVVSIETPNLGDRSYVVGQGSSAIVIDPQRDIDRVEEILDQRGWSVSHVLETHFHNDYVSGGFQLARVLGAEYVVSSGMDIAFSANQVSGNDEIESDVALIRVLHTPGHTPNHLSFALNFAGEDLALFTGGSLLFGSVGRPDLLGVAMTQPLAHAQWNSMQRIASEVTNSAQVYPTHGFGSFCSASATVGSASTVAYQMLTNPVFSVDEEAYVCELIAGLDIFPTYYAHMGPANQAGAGPIDLSLPQVATAQDIAERIARGEWVVDLRHRKAYAADHLRGTLSFDVYGNAVTYLGWMIDWGTPITLLGADASEVATMQRELVRIGIDRPVAHAVGAPSDWNSKTVPTSSYRRATHVEMAQALKENELLPMIDLRRNSEFDDGYVQGAKHVPLHELRGRVDEVKTWAAENADNGPIWIYCGSGFRASIGASLLEAADVAVIHVDDDFPNAEKAGLIIERPPHGHRIGAA
ncbi:MAG: MBL fold metallo-hydrolase [Candidatus Nanopelagicales bacterium]|nr:MBL fold metallo-hydrolase [Candidatus Nanopelagicales bacterium]